MMSLRLFYARGSCALAALIALEQADANYGAVAVDLAAGEQHRPNFLSINPLGRVPVLMVDHEPITELIAVLSYIAQCYPAAGLLPSGDPLAIARCYERLSWFATNVHIAVAQMARGERFSDDAQVRDQLKAPARQRLQAHLVQLDAELEAEDLPPAGGLTLADTLHPVMWRWAERFDVSTDKLSHWRRVVEAVHQQPAVQRAFDVEAGIAAHEQRKRQPGNRAQDE